MIRIYLVRHGIAVDPGDSGGLPDDDRPLTAKGRRRFPSAPGAARWERGLPLTGAKRTRAPR